MTQSTTTNSHEPIAENVAKQRHVNRDSFVESLCIQRQFHDSLSENADEDLLVLILGWNNN